MVRERRGGVVFPVVLISLGVILLLNNLGLLSWSVWGTLLRLWPLLLVAVGLDIMLGRRSAWVSLVVVVLVVGVAGAALWFAAPSLAGTTQYQTMTINQPLENATQADVRLSFTTGRLVIGALPESSGLIEGTVMHDPQEQVTPSFRISGDTAYYELKPTGTGTGIWFPGDTVGENKVWDLNLNRDVPMHLRIDSGVGQSTIDLSRTQVDNLEIHGGVGEVTLTVPRQGNVQALIDGGVGNVVVLVPNGVAVRIRADGGLGGVQVDSSFQHQGNEYISSNYDTAQNRVDLQINGGIGRVTVRQVNES